MYLKSSFHDKGPSPGSVAFRIFCTLLALLATAACQAERVERIKPLFGTSVRIVVHHDSAKLADEIIDETLDFMQAFDSVFSDYDSSSELRQLTVAGSSAYEHPKVISQSLFEVLSTAETVSQQTDGAFDVTVGPVVRLWRRAARNNSMPKQALLQQAMESVGYRHLQLATAADGEPTVYLARPKMRLDLGGIAKGYIADAALRRMRGHGAPIGLVDAGGDIAVGDPPPGRGGWRIGLSTGELNTLIELRNCAVATSGDAARAREICGQRVSHVIDARTGRPTIGSWTATVVADSCTLADAYASAAMVMGPEVISQLPVKVQALVVRRESANESKRYFATPGFSDLMGK